ncbi:hypothetical protein [Polyangium jinanense]|uniref:Uncharacterized protein n=1 Tax=Polyangium jinanense TaxID=2829994 RepID=A0A9X3X1Y9_9BACT|nr:hypothetical protein [Polyangium jinanense]MDC3955602.1 hypothetical protein [Polyangium jinanense]MDC3982244.1 hypothetical protein [Polyangium jinanense]
MVLKDDLTLDVDGLRLRLKQTEAGPLLATDHPRDDPRSTLAYVVNTALTGGWSDLEESIMQRRGTNVPQAMGATPVRPEDVAYADRLNWRNLGGRTLDDTDAFIIGTTFTSADMIMPGKTLLRILRKLGELRGQRPPSGEAEPEAPPTPTEPPFSLLTGSTAIELDERAAELDMVARKTPKTPRDEGTELGGRTCLLIEMDAAGLFEEGGEEEKRQWLVEARLTALLGYYDAGVALLRYLRDPARKRYIPDAPEGEGVLDAWVSIDWFRLGIPTPPSMKPVNWLGFCERTLREAEPDPSEDEGEVYTTIGSERYHIEWRRDVRRPAVLRASVVVRS